MTQTLPYLSETASQTAGPYVHIGLVPSQAGFDIFANNFTNNLLVPGVAGEAITIEGRIFDGTDTPIRDMLVEIWQANSFGRYNSAEDQHQSLKLEPDFRGWGRTGTDFETGLFTFQTIKPGKVGDQKQAPHVSFWMAARGINVGLATRMYFADEVAANASDPVLNIIEQASRRQTLIAERSMRDGKPVYTFNMYLQGPKETVFFDI